jgi:predicted carbohydrate-binding protein with CBM5 and CBM33 domain
VAGWAAQIMAVRMRSLKTVALLAVATNCASGGGAVSAPSSRVQRNMVPEGTAAQVGQGATSAGAAPPVGQRRQWTLSQYDQVGAEVNGTLNTSILRAMISETNANTFSFLLWDTDGHQ